MIKEAIEKLMQAENLTYDQVKESVDEIMTGQASPALIASFLTALSIKGETDEEIAGAAEFQVFLCDLEAVVGGTERLQALAGLLALVGGDQDAIGFGVASSHAPSKLVELGESKALGVLDDHEGCPGHVHAYLDDGGGAEDVDVSGGEGSHDRLLVLSLHLPVEQAHPQVGEHLGL